MSCQGDGKSVTIWGEKEIQDQLCSACQNKKVFQWNDEEMTAQGHKQDGTLNRTNLNGSRKFISSGVVTSITWHKALHTLLQETIPFPLSGVGGAGGGTGTGRAVQ